MKNITFTMKLIKINEKNKLITKCKISEYAFNDKLDINSNFPKWYELEEPQIICLLMHMSLNYSQFYGF